MYRAVNSISGVILECNSFKTLYRAVHYTIRTEGDDPSIWTIYKDGNIFHTF